MGPGDEDIVSLIAEILSETGIHVDVGRSLEADTLLTITLEDRSFVVLVSGDTMLYGASAVAAGEVRSVEYDYEECPDDAEVEPEGSA